jgi:hypothetical protein
MHDDLGHGAAPKAPLAPSAPPGPTLDAAMSWDELKAQLGRSEAAAGTESGSPGSAIEGRLSELEER